MKKLRILVLHASMPETTSVTSLFIKNLLPELESLFEVHMIWVIHKTSKLEKPFLSNYKETIVDIHNFKNAAEVIKETKPDLIYATVFPNFLHYAFSMAAKKQNILVLSGIFSKVAKINRPKMIFSYLRLFFNSNIKKPELDNVNDIPVLHRSHFFFRINFLLRTLFITEKNYLISFKKFFSLFILNIITKPHEYNKKFENDFHWVDGEYAYKKTIDAGFKKSNVIITGNPMFDPVSKKIQQIKKNKKRSEKIRVLLITMNLYEHGLWSKQQRNDIFKKIVKELTKYENLELSVKIHPLNENLDSYKKLLDEINVDIPIYQKGDILEYLEKTNVVICYITDTAAEYALLCEIPIIITNFYNLENDFLINEKLATNCTEISKLNENILKVNEKNLINASDIDKYVKQYLLKIDGKAGKRVAELIKQRIEKNE